MCNQEETRSAILDRLVDQLCPVRAPGLCRRFGGQTDCFRAPEDGEDVVARLAAEFSEEQLEASGVMPRGADGQLTWARSLGTPGSVVVAQRENEGQPPYNLLTPLGNLIGHDAAILSTLRDYRTELGLRKTTDRMFVCTSTTQIPFFRSVYLPATTSGGLMDLNGAQLRELFQRLGWHESSASENVASGMTPVNVIFVNWHPETLSAEPCDEIRQLAGFCARVERWLGIDMSRCAVWTATVEEVADVDFCLGREDLSAATDALLSSANESSHFVSVYGDPEFQPRREPADFLEALCDIERHAEQFDGNRFGEERRRRAIATYEERVEADLVGPLVEHVAESEDPWEVNLGMLAAESLRLIHRQAPILRHGISKLVQDPTSQGDQKAVMAQLRDRERQIANVTRLIKVLKG